MTRRRPLLAALALVAAAAAACAAPAVPAARQTNTDVSFHDCSKVQCADKIDGAAYQILLPKQWNGTLLLYSHGYRQAQPAPPNFTAPSTKAEPAPGYSDGDKTVSDALLKEGYALAGSAYASNGWAVADGVKADEDLYAFFVKNVAKPYRVYAWGDSLGGLVTEMLAEKHHDWVSGAAPLCGVLGGPEANLNLALDVSYSLKALFNPSLKLTGYTSWNEAVQNWVATAKIVQDQLTGPDAANAAARLMFVGALVDAPTQTSSFDGGTLQRQVEATAESVLTALGYSTFGRYDIEQRFGGDPSGNVDADYAQRINEGERTLVDTLGGKGETAKLLAQLAAGTRVSPDAAAAVKFAASGTPTGDLQIPTITMHTTADPLVLVQNENLFFQRVTANAKRTQDLVQLYIAPPKLNPAEEKGKDPDPTWTPENPAPFGAGHCNFAAESRIGIIKLLDEWVRNDVYPGRIARVDEIGSADESGYAAAFQPSAWPDPRVK